MTSNIPVKQKWPSGKHTKQFDFNRNEFQRYNRKRYGIYGIPYTCISLGFRPFFPCNSCTQTVRIRRYQLRVSFNGVCGAAAVLGKSPRSQIFSTKPIGQRPSTLYLLLVVLALNRRRVKGKEIAVPSV